MRSTRHLAALAAATVAACLTAAPLTAQQAASTGHTVTLVVTGHAAKGTVAAALFSAADGFPQKDGQAAQRLMVPASTASDTIVFRNLPAGRYAVAVYHDANGNAKLDTNLFGMPREAWGVSNNVHPSMRSPRFEEAAFDVRGASIIAVTVR